MTDKKKKKTIGKIFLLIAGSLVLVCGIVLILQEWEQVVKVFQGVIGMIMALAGLLILMLVKD